MPDWTVDELARMIDHSLLHPMLDDEQLIKGMAVAVERNCASVCIKPYFVGIAAKLLDGTGIRTGTVVGFPHGSGTVQLKIDEAKQAVDDGADEIDMVVPVGAVKSGAFEEIEAEIRAVKDACGEKTLKVIVETCLLDDGEKRRLCAVVAAAGAEYIKTSTGFQAGGATFEDVALMREASPDTLKIKAAGGISSFEDAARFLALGADRLGTSRLVKILKNEAQHGY